MDIQISNRQLIDTQYSIDILTANINNLNKDTILSTQELTVKFCTDYILDTDIEGSSEDSYKFDIDYILYFQQHLKREDFITYIDSLTFNS
jgi:hypothetical protein